MSNIKTKSMHGVLVKTITYEDFDGNTLTEDFYFKLSEAEVIEWEMSEAGGITQTIKRITAAMDAPAIMKYFKKLIEVSYGVKSPDAKRIIKSPELTKAFMETNAYSELVMELLSVQGAAEEFVRGMLPQPKNGTPAVVK